MRRLTDGAAPWRMRRAGIRAGARMRIAAACAAAAVLAGCASAPQEPGAVEARAVPLLRLDPSSLGHSLNLQQHITVRAPGHEQQLDVLLEADAAHVQLGVVALGQVAARLSWDGTTLTEDRAPWWPQVVSGARILSDVQLTLWPVAAIQAALPAGWKVVEAGATRTLTDGGDVVTVVTRRNPRVVDIDQQREHYWLTIESQDLGVPAPVAPAPDPH